MTKTEARRLAALAALLAAAVAAADEAHADPRFKITVNGANLNGITVQGMASLGADGNGVTTVQDRRGADPGRLRLRAVRLATPAGDIGVVAGRNDEPEPIPIPE